MPFKVKKSVASMLLSTECNLKVCPLNVNAVVPYDSMLLPTLFILRRYEVLQNSDIRCYADESMSGSFYSGRLICPRWNWETGYDLCLKKKPP